MPRKIIGTAPDQVPLNAYLGKLAFQDEVNIVTDNPLQDTAISDVKPSLMLDFANSKTLDPRITYTRASTASYYDGKTTAVAEQNLLTYSQDFDNGTGWSTNGVTVTANSTSAPNSTTTAELITSSGGGIPNRFYPTVNSTVSAGSAVFSVYAKQGTERYVQLYDNISGNNYANFDLQTGVVSATGAGVTATITSASNGFYRIAIYATYSAGVVGFRIAFTDNNGTATYSPTISTVGLTFYGWGAQLEQRSAVSSYTPTASQPITNYIPALQTAAAGVPRFDHNPVTGESKGFLIEEQRSNLLTYSSSFDNAAWTKYQTTIAATANVAPDGTQTASLLAETTLSGEHKAYTGAITASNTAHTVSVYAKAATRSKFWIEMFDGVSSIVRYNFDLMSGTGSYNTVIGSWTSPSYSITSVGNGWYRCTVTATKGAGTGIITTLMILNASGTASSYTGDGFSGIYIWGAQLEAGSFATSYIPTTSTQVTRAADSAGMFGSNFSSWYRADEGTLYAQCTTFATGTSGRSVIEVNDGTMANRTYIYTSPSGTSRTLGFVGGSAVVTTLDVASPISSASIAYKTSNWAASYAGGNALLNSYAGVIPNQNTLLIGYSTNGGFQLNGTIKKLAYYPKRLSDAELQEMTL